MATWTVEPTWKKSIVERAFWRKDGKTIINEIGWRWGTLTIETEGDDPPEVDEDTDYMCDSQFSLVDFETSDGCWEENEFTGDWDEDEQEELEERLNDGEISVYELEEEGWILDETEMYITCEVEITRLDDDGNPTGEVIKSGDSTEELTEVQQLNPQAKWPFENATEPTEFLKFKCVACDYSTEDIEDLLENTHDDDRGAFLCPECESKVETE